MDTFNRAFGFPVYEPWTIEDLECRLKSIRQILKPTDSKLNTIEDILQSLIRLTPSAELIKMNDQPDAIQRVAQAFTKVKHQFIESNPNSYAWFHESCTWLNTAQRVMNEYRHDDILTYYFRGQSYSVMIIFLTTINADDKIVILSIGSTIRGKMIRIPLGEYSIAQDYLTPLQEIFDTELKNLLLSIYHELKPIQ